MENDLISRKDAIEAIRSMTITIGGNDVFPVNVKSSVLDVLEFAPSVEAEPVRHGRWEWYEEERNSMFPDGDYGWRCSNCKQDLAAELALGIHGMHYAHEMLDDPDHPPTLKRCLFCGAKMDGGAE